MVVHCSKKLKNIYIYIKLLSLLSLKKNLFFFLSPSFSLSVTFLLSFSFASHFFFLSSTTLISSLLRQPTRRPISLIHLANPQTHLPKLISPTHKPIPPRPHLPKPHCRFVTHAPSLMSLFWICVCVLSLCLC